MKIPCKVCGADIARSGWHYAMVILAAIAGGIGIGAGCVAVWTHDIEFCILCACWVFVCLGYSLPQAYLVLAHINLIISGERSNP